MADYKPGSMDIRDKQKTFDGFIRFVMWGAGLSILFLVILALADA